MNTSALLEIGIEHLPARFLDGAFCQMESLAVKFLQENNLPYSSVHAFGTFRKLALQIDGLPLKAGDIQKEVKGPPVKLFKTPDGKFTAQSAGFAERNGVKPENLVIKGDFLYAEIKIKGEKTSKILADIFPKIITGLEFPKNMVWEESGLRFARPIRTILALYGDKVVNFSVAGVKSGRETLPLSSFGMKGIKIKDVVSYADTLQNQKTPIFVEPSKRREVILKALETESKKLGYTVEQDDALVNETVNMTEHPVAAVGNFDLRFLALPKNLIVTVLRTQTRIFPVVNEKGEIQPHFIAFRDGLSVNQKEVVDGFRKVMSARLSDAVFFFEQDAKKGLKYFRDKLATVRFIDGLGTMLERADRTEKLAVWLSEKAGADTNICAEGARFAYADLTSSVVYEFPELQGYMGGVYAAKEGMSQYVAKALEEFYYPLNAASALPSTKEAAIVSLSGKMDAVTGNFAANQIPTGSEDPFALRRQAIGIVRMIMDYNLPVTLPELCEASVRLYAGKCSADCTVKLEQFLFARLMNMLSEEGIGEGVLNTLHACAGKPLKDTVEVAKVLFGFKEDESIKAVSESAKRVCNILKKNTDALPAVNAALFETPEEKTLYETLSSVSAVLKTLGNNYIKVFETLASFKDSLSAFFDKVMVNAENKNVRLNRLALLDGVRKILTEDVADITKLQ